MSDFWMANMRARYFAVFISFSFIFFLAAAILSKDVTAEGNTLPPIDVIILVDVSGSMRFTDPDRIVLTALADFIDKLEPNISRVGIIGFNGHIQHRIPFTYTDIERKEWLREELSRFVYVGYTDIGLAFMYALDMIEDVTALNNPMIIFTSDGYIQISRLNPRRTAQMSYLDIEAALDTLDVMVPVYTVGMHNPDGIDVPLLEMISERSGGLSKFTYHADELPDILAAIFEHHVERSRVEEPELVDDKTYEDNEGVEEVEEPEEEPDEEPLPAIDDTDEVIEEETESFVMGVMHYLAIFFSLTALLAVLRFISLVI